MHVVVILLVLYGIAGVLVMVLYLMNRQRALRIVASRPGPQTCHKDRDDPFRLPFTNFIQRSSEGAASCRKWALRALQKNSKTRRLCWRQVAITVQTRSHQRCPRLPRVPCVI